LNIPATIVNANIFQGFIRIFVARFNGSGLTEIIDCQRKYSFVQRKRIFLYKTVGDFLLFLGCASESLASESKIAKPAAMVEESES
jgi:hypothetical protein